MRALKFQRPNGAQAALQIIQSYVQQPDVAKRLQEDEAFAQRLQKYNAQYQFVIQQAENAQIGRIGTQPAQMGQVKDPRHAAVMANNISTTDYGRFLANERLIKIFKKHLTKRRKF